MGEIDCIEVAPEIPVEGIEQLLKYLPNPSSATFYLCGEFDYSAVEAQVKELVGGEGWHHSAGFGFYLNNPTKETILKSYRTLKEDEEILKDPNYKAVKLKEAEWKLSDGVTLCLTPCEVTIGCRGSLPEYISKMTRELADEILFVIHQHPTQPQV